MPTNDTISAGSLLVERLADELARRWRAGERPLVEEYLAQYPDLSKQPEAVAELIYEELCLRQEFGQTEAADDVLRRFPQWREQLRVLIQCHDFLQPPAALSFPAPGDTLGDFHLLAELGRGAQGRVFLATQTTLADRPVVLKLAPRSGQEHLSLARLQHTHIVPLYSVEDDPARALRALCMPYFGGATLAQLLELLRGQPLSGRTGRHLLEALRKAQDAAPLRIPVDGPACQFLGQVSYARAICWLGICLAEALQYTHERGLVHLDLKPSNVLWAADGQPMLLDLHLARPPVTAGEPGPVWLGGTPPYMAPEQRLAIACVEENRSVPADVDGRADLYSLGLVLCEALSEALPPPGQAAPWLLARNPQVTVGLADILNKCLADNPGDRYPDAAALVDDLRCHLADRPLHCAPNRSLAERWRKWRRRRPYQRIVLALALAVAAAGGLAALYIGQEGHKARAALADAKEHLERGEYSPARAACRRGLAMAEGLPFHQDLAEELRGELQRADRAAAAQELHLLAERLRALYGADGTRGAAHAEAAAALGAHCRDLWLSRDLIVRRLGTQSALVQEQIHNDLLDVAILWTDLRVRLAGKNDVPIRGMALEVLAQAETLFGPSCVLDCAYRAHNTALEIAVVEKKAAPP
ncbi:MAG TPA: serine/threonine-protein kinase, partial [Gemmataceae bacterium]|nr:serine/threonine-protein kinase [Gemmataceae bacterium]